MLVALKTPLRLGGFSEVNARSKKSWRRCSRQKKEGISAAWLQLWKLWQCINGVNARHALENKLWLHEKVTRLVNTVSFGLDIGDSTGTALISWNPYLNLQFWLFTDSPSWCWSRKDCEMHQACPRVWVAGSSLRAMRWNSKSKKHHVLSSI